VYERQGAGRGAYEGYASDESGTSWDSVVLGWLAAVGAFLILSTIVSGIVGAILGTGGTAEQARTVFAIGMLTALFVAFLIGGYAAGRMASRSGSKHGLLVALFGLIVTLILVLLGGVVGYSLIDDLSAVTIPGVPNIVPQGLNTVLTLSSVLALILPFVAGALGGSRGAHTSYWRP
jgi:hypothetical protein